LAAIDAADTAAVPGTVAWLGALAALEAATDTAAIAGQVSTAGISGTFSPLEGADVFASPGSIIGTFLNPGRTSARVSLSNSNLTATRAS
jgi:hypothetical protein